MVCDPLESINEGIEFSLQLGAGRDWIPVALFFRGHHNLSNRAPGIIINRTLVIRGFQVEEVILEKNTPYNYTLTVCDTTEPASTQVVANCSHT